MLQYYIKKYIIENVYFLKMKKKTTDKHVTIVMHFLFFNIGSLEP